MSTKPFICTQCGEHFGLEIHVCQTASSGSVPGGEAVQSTPPGPLVSPAPGPDERTDRFLRVIVAVRQTCSNAIVGAGRKKFDMGMKYLAERVLREIRETNKTVPEPQPLPPPTPPMPPDVEKLVEALIGAARHVQFYADSPSVRLQAQAAAQLQDASAALLSACHPQAQPIPPEAGTLDAVAEYLREMAKQENPGKGPWCSVGSASKTHWRLRAQEVIEIASRPIKKGES